jgi:hypothetical protein
MERNFVKINQTDYLMVSEPTETDQEMAVNGYVKVTSAQFDKVFILYEKVQKKEITYKDVLRELLLQKQFCYIEIAICSPAEIVEPNPNPQNLDTAVWYQDFQFWVNSSKFVNRNGKTYLKGEIITREEQDTAECRLDCDNDIIVWVHLSSDRILGIE